MKQIKKMINKHDVIVMIVLIVLISIGDIIYKGIASGDEYLLLNHTLKMYNRKNYL